MPDQNSSTEIRPTLSIIMYHYVRPQEPSLNLNIRSLTEFRRQLDYVTSNYRVLSPDDFYAWIAGSLDYEGECCYLTFDDGYLDHYRYVLPELLKRGLRAGFYPSVNPIEKKLPLDVNKIQYLLASIGPIALFDFVKRRSLEDLDYKIETESMFESLESSRYGDFYARAVKALLQYMLSTEMRRFLIDRAFQEFIKKDDETLCDELYMTKDQVMELVDHGMDIGGHGASHVWLGKEAVEKVDQEMQLVAKFLNSLGIDRDRWTICYPSGSYNDVVIDSAKSLGAVAGLTTSVGKNDIETSRIFNAGYTLKRFDTNDLPH